MPQPQLFRAFFSYSHQDADADPGLIDSLTRQLATRVNIKLVNDHFEIWRDVEGIRLGDKWNDKLESALRSSDVLIVLLTPRWLGSDLCRTEFAIFERIEVMRALGDYVAGYIVPIVARKLDRQEQQLTSPQKEIYERILSRQHQTILAADFRKLSQPRRLAIIDKIADDIEGMIERRRMHPLASRDLTDAPPIRTPKRLAFDGKAHNFNEVDFISNAEVVLKRLLLSADRALFAQLDFVERLYVQAKLGRVEFGVRRAFLTVLNQGAGSLEKLDEFKGKRYSSSASYRSLQEAPAAISICMNPSGGRTSLAELALPVSENDGSENYLSKIAIASGEVKAENLMAELIVSLNSEGLYLTGDNAGLSLKTQAKIKAIMDAAAAKYRGAKDRTITTSGQFRRTLQVGPRE